MTESAPERRDDGAPPAPDQADLFGALGVSDALVRAIKELGFEEPTPIQTQAVPAALAGRDVIGQAQTGTGKTAAFGLPVVERVDPADRRVQAVILCPTRELAVQVAEELSSSPGSAAGSRWSRSTAASRSSGRSRRSGRACRS